MLFLPAYVTQRQGDAVSESFGGWSALLEMLTSCAGGVGVVNIDNGFGAACLASMINQL